MYRGATAWSHLHFYAGQTVQRVTVIAENDDLNDDGESLTFYLGEMPAGYAVLLNRRSAKVNIEDTDDPNSVVVSFQSGNYYASEDGGPARVTVVMQPVPDRTITIPITFTRGGGLTPADHTTVTTSVTSEAGVPSYSSESVYQTIEIWAVDDSFDDDGEYLDITFGSISDQFTSERTGKHRGGNRRSGFLRDANETRVWFEDNDFTEVAVSNPLDDTLTMSVGFSEGVYSAHEGGEVATVEVQLYRVFDREREVTIPITVERMGGASPADTDTRYSSIPSSITFKPGQTAQTFRVAARDDDVDDDGEWLQLSFGTLPERISAAGNTTARVNLVDNDHPQTTLNFEKSSYDLTAEGDAPGVSTNTIEIKVTVSRWPERVIEIPVYARRISGAGELQFPRARYIYAAATTGVAIQPEATEATISIVAWAPSDFQPGETYELSFGSLPERVSTGDRATATVTVNANP